MVDGRIEGLGRRVVGEAQDVAAANAGHATGPGDEQETQGAHAPDQIRIGAFAGARFAHREGVELEATDEVVGEDSRRCGPSGGGPSRRSG